MTNRPSLNDILGDPACLIGQPLEVVSMLIDDADEMAKRAALAKKLIATHLEHRFAASIDAAYQAQAKDTGTVRLDQGPFEIVADRAKKVEWDQAKLADARAQIMLSGDDPNEYIDTTYSVPERKYSAWPAHIRKVFEPARTLKPGALTVKLLAREVA